MPHYGRGCMGRQVAGHAWPRVIRMAVRDQRAIHRAPRIDVEIASGAINTAVGECQHVSHAQDDSPSARAANGLGFVGRSL